MKRSFLRRNFLVSLAAGPSNWLGKELPDGISHSGTNQLAITVDSPRRLHDQGTTMERPANWVPVVQGSFCMLAAKVLVAVSPRARPQPVPLGSRAARAQPTPQGSRRLQSQVRAHMQWARKD